MLKPRQVLLGVILLLGISLSPLMNGDLLTSYDSNNSSRDNNQPVIASNWFEAGSQLIDGVELRDLSGEFSLAHGTFDPLFDATPEIPDFWKSDDDFSHTRMKFVQLNVNDYQSMYDLEESGHIRILDLLGDGNLIIRVLNTIPNSLELVENSEQTRWLGDVHPGYRIHPDLLDNIYPETLAVVPAKDLAVGGYGELALDLIKYGAHDAWCGYTLCQVKVSYSSDFLVNVANDGRVIWTEPMPDMVVHNSVARAISGVVSVESNASFTLDGSGEMIAIADTGLDRDHPDIDGRVAAVYTQFGLDTSPVDSNGGHGTHVTLTAVGDGSSDSSTKGIAPAATVTMYALEHDPTGVFGRQGSIYDLLADAKQKTARIAINAWGLNGNYGEYTADSRSVDQFVKDERTLLPVFSVGDWDGNGVSSVTAPSTAKNVLSVGVSTTGSGGSPPQGSVDSVSREGTTADGRIKPDVVAPGIEICSGRAEEARTPSGFACATGTLSLIHI